MQPSLPKMARAGSGSKPFLRRPCRRATRIFRQALIFKEEADNARHAETPFIDSIGMALGALLLQICGVVESRPLVANLSEKDRGRILE